MCVCVWGGGEQGVCENGGGLEISPFGVTTLSGKRGGDEGDEPKADPKIVIRS